jgi:Adenylate kinase
MSAASRALSGLAATARGLQQATWTPEAFAAGRRQINTRTAQEALDPERIQWVFLGPPGVGKGTYSTRVAVALGVAHIAAGDLVRGEIKSRSALGRQVRSIGVYGIL